MVETPQFNLNPFTPIPQMASKPFEGIPQQEDDEDAQIMVAPALQSRRGSRKQPPALTESLEQLALISSPKSSISSASSSPIVAIPPTIQEQSVFTLAVDIPKSLSSPSSPRSSIATTQGSPLPVVAPIETKRVLKKKKRPVVPDNKISLPLRPSTGDSSSSSPKVGTFPGKLELPARPATANPPPSIGVDLSTALNTISPIITTGLPPPIPRKSISRIPVPGSSRKGSDASTVSAASGISEASTIMPFRTSSNNNGSTLQNPSLSSIRTPSLSRPSTSSSPSSSNSWNNIVTPPQSCTLRSIGGESLCGDDHLPPWNEIEIAWDESPVGKGIAYHKGKGKGKKSETRKEKKQRKIAEKAAFTSDQPPSLRDLYMASLLPVIDEHGEKVCFGDLVRGKKTIVVFIRHWFCPLCAQYMNSIIKEVSQSALDEAEVDLVIIGNGSARMLDGYKNKHFKCPFKMYTDPTLHLYRALGLTRQTMDAGPPESKGSYIVQSGLESTLQTLKRATQMPLGNFGHINQIGGEFIFDGTLNVIWTHRMENTRDHIAIRDVCEFAGVELPWIHYEPGDEPPLEHRYSYRSGSSRSTNRSNISFGQDLQLVEEHPREEVYEGEVESYPQGLRQALGEVVEPVVVQARSEVEEEDAVSKRYLEYRQKSTPIEPHKEWLSQRNAQLERIRQLKLARRNNGGSGSGLRRVDEMIASPAIVEIDDDGEYLHDRFGDLVVSN